MGGKQCMEPTKTVDNIPFGTYDNTQGRSKLPCSRLSEVFPAGSYHQRSGGNTAWVVQPPYAAGMNQWANSKYNSPFVCASDRVCLPEVHDSMNMVSSDDDDS